MPSDSGQTKELVHSWFRWSQALKDEVFHPSPQAVSWGVLLGFCLLFSLSAKWNSDECCLCKKGKICTWGVLYESLGELPVHPELDPAAEAHCCLGWFSEGLLQLPWQ